MVHGKGSGSRLGWEVLIDREEGLWLPKAVRCGGTNVPGLDCDVRATGSLRLVLSLRQLESVGGRLTNPWPERAGRRETPPACRL